MNLYDETVRILEQNGKTIKDIVFVQGNSFRISVSNFIEVAKTTDYDSGFGASEIASDLVLVGDGFWLERGEYDGSEWWEFKEPPSRLERTESVNSLSIVGEQIGWETLESILNYNEEEEF